MRKVKILVVEDQPIIALDYRFYFEEKGYDCKTFSSGKDALEYIKSEKPDLALLDIRLRDQVSGLEIGEYLKALNVPLIFISAFSDPENHSKAILLEPAFIFQKPINFAELYRAVEIVLNRRLENDTDVLTI